MEMTSIQISSNLQAELNRKKLFSKETYEEIIWDMIEDTKELSEETKKDIAEGRAQAKRGETITLEEFKKRYKL
ncbi:hypothetical protein EXS73_00795 [Candidatus Pacearchaeota archaeon]|nr:hypothetical protein [Candidatus Pacearchaeota archaeon]